MSTRILAANPSDPRARLDFAEVYIDLHKLDEAASQLQRAIALDPGLARRTLCSVT